MKKFINVISWPMTLIGFVVVVVLTTMCGCQNSKPEAANEAAADYMKKVPGATGYECADRDTDGDGYCSCTVFRGSADPMPLACGCERWCTPFAGAGKR